MCASSDKILKPQPEQSSRRGGKLWFIALAVLACVANTAQAAISVGATPAAPITFDAIPAVADWSTRNMGGGGGDITTTAQMDAAVQTNTAALINTVLGTSPTQPPSANALARQHSVNLDVQTCPTGVGYVALMATLVNDSGANASSLAVTYNLRERSQDGTTVTEEIPAHRVYYSLTGEANSWVFVPELSSATVADNGTTPVSATFTLTGNWNNGANLYLLWTDDNAAADRSNGGTEEGAYTIDDVTFAAIAGNAPPTVRINVPTDASTYVQSAVIPVSATAGGPVTNVDFYLDSATAPYFQDFAFPYGFSLDTLTLPLGVHRIWARGYTNTTGYVLSHTNTFTIVANTGPGITSWINPTNFSVIVGTPITNVCRATDDLAVVKVDWYIANNFFFTCTNSPFGVIYNSSLPGTNVPIFGIAYDAAGLSATSAPVLITVTNPPANFVLAVTNQADWYYYATSNAPPNNGDTPWYSGSYFPSIMGWPLGNSEFGFGDDAKNPPIPERTLIDGGPGASRYLSTYYARNFYVSDDRDPSFWVGMVMRLLRDDGAVVWINGIPVWTNNIAVTNTAITYNTLAANAGDNGTAWQEVVLSAQDIGNLGLTLLPEASGANYVAIEVHQSSPTSSDLSFDFMLWGIEYEPPSLSIVAPTNGQVFVEGSPATVTLSASATLTNVTVYYDGVEVGQDATRPFVVTIPSVGTPGTHQITANGLDAYGDSASATPVNIVVIPNQPPTVSIIETYSSSTGLTFRVGSFLTTRVTASDADGTVTALELWSNDRLVTARTNLNLATVTTNLIDPDVLAGNPVLRAVSVDNSGKRGTSAPVVLTITNRPLGIVLTNGSVWKYWNTVTNPPNDGLGRAWTDPNYDDSGWASGQAELGGGDGGDNPPVTETTLIDIGPTGARYSAVYFRHAVTVANPSQYSGLLVDILPDDGAVVYINGAESFRTNMPAGPVDYTTFALGAIGGDGTIYFPTNVANTLVAGRNVVAVEVHQNNATSSDISFDLMIWGETGAGERPTVKIEVVDASNVSISWTPTGGHLESTDTLASNPALTVWTNEGTANPVTKSTAGLKRFYRVVVP